MKCSNCDTVALWVYRTESVAPTPYCDACLPRFLRQAARAGTLAKADGYAAVETEVAEALAPSAEAVEEPVVEEARRRRPRRAEEPVVEESVEAVVAESVEA